MLDLDAPGVATSVAERIKHEIDEYCVKTYNDGYRKHLGASLIGRQCPRELWYTFRWVGALPKDGRLYRLFNRGHREEERFVEWLRGIGFTIETHDDDGKQVRVVGVQNHYGGSRDGRGIFPPHWNISERVLLEFKTSGTGSKFDKLLHNGVILEKQEHFAQMSVYGWKSGIRFALYMCINKNDDDLHIEIVKLDWKLAEQLEHRAQTIITSATPPERISESPTFWQCKFCDYKPVCHDKQIPEKNCRSCKSAKPANEGAWHCERFNAIIPEDFIPQGCANWTPIV